MPVPLQMESHTFVGGFFIKLIAYTMKKELKGNSYKQRVIEVNEIFDVHARVHVQSSESSSFHKF